MNIFLIPYTPLRHLSMALWCGGVGVLAWWLALSWVVLVGPSWTPEWDGPILMCTVASAIAGANVLGEGNLERLPMLKRLARTALAMALTAGFSMMWYWIWHKLALAILFSGDMERDALDPSLVSLRYRIGAFMMAGVSCGLGPMIVRKAEGWATHLMAGIAAGLATSASWYLMTYIVDTDLYRAGAVLGLSFGFAYGFMAWGIPDRYYAGWVRVLRGGRYGRRIPVDAPDGKPRERFVGHFPRGLDMFLPVEEQVLELHVSVAVDDKQNYKLRGLTLAPTLVRRFLEKLDLRYDPRRPAPLETKLSSGDRVLLGQGAQHAEIEFIMLPREEQ